MVVGFFDHLHVFFRNTQLRLYFWGGIDDEEGMEGIMYISYIYDKPNRGPIVVNHCKPTWLIYGEPPDSTLRFFRTKIKMRREQRLGFDWLSGLLLKYTVGIQKFHSDILSGCIVDDYSWDSYIYMYIYVYIYDQQIPTI
jgi:hypothetical protein